MPNCDSMPSFVFAYGPAIIPALLISTSMLEMVEFIEAAAARTESWLEKSTGTKRTFVEGLIEAMSLMTCSTLDAVRARSTIVAGLPAAR